MVTYEEVNAGVERLSQAGLYAKGTHPIDWENMRRGGRPPHLIRGGTHVEVADDIRIVHGSFMIDVSEDSAAYEVRWLAPSNRRRVGTFDEAVSLVLDLAASGDLGSV